jgi:surface antigen
VTCFTLGETTNSSGSRFRHLPERLSPSLICERACGGAGSPINFLRFHAAMTAVSNNRADPTGCSKEEMAMAGRIGSLVGMAALAGMLAFASGACAQTTAAPVENAAPTPDNAILLTVFLKHDQSRRLSELNAQLAKQGFYKAFPPPGMEVLSWYVAMGIGQVVTLRLPASRLREVNRVLENTAWGSYRTEFYPTYDYKAVGLEEHDKAR